MRKQRRQGAGRYSKSRRWKVTGAERTEEAETEESGNKERKTCE